MSAEPHQSEYYDREQLDDKRPLQDFHQFLKDSLIPTDNPAAREKRNFVPFQKLADYLAEDNRLEQLLWAIFEDEDPIPVEVPVVLENYLKVLCILISIGKGRYVRNFVEYEELHDSHLPFYSEPARFPASTCQPNLWVLFSEKQWMFCPAEMVYKTYNSLDPHRILPIVKREVLAEGGSATVSKIVLHPLFNKLRRPLDLRLAGPFKDTFVLKTYHAIDASAYYHNEVQAFRHLRPPPAGSDDPNIIHFYGSYTQNGTYNVILDFADQGNLEQYFQNTFPPTKGSDILNFWTSLCNTIKALVHIHNPVEVQNTTTGPQILQGWHQDVKPKNILVKSNSENSPYKWTFILSDLGLAHFKRTTSQESSDIDVQGTQTYGAPECYREDRFLENSPLPVKQNTDIWSFGCILCEAAVWLVHGYGGLKKFRSDRKDAIAQDPDTKDGDWFHNGRGQVLPVVLETIAGLTRDLRVSDRVTQSILEDLIIPMLDVPDARLSAKQLYIYATRICKRASNSDSPQTPTSNSTVVIRKTIITPVAQPPPSPSQPTSLPIISGLSLHPTPTTVPTAQSTVVPDTGSQSTSTSNLSVPVPTPSTNPSPSLASTSGSVTPANTTSTPSARLPTLQVEVAEKWINERKAGRLTGALPHDDLLRRLETRDHLFLIDDAASMKPHEAAVKRILGILAYLLRNADPDGMELYFTGAPGKFKSKDPSKLVEKFQANNPKGLTNIRIRFDNIIDGYIEGLDRSWFRRKIKPIRSLNIYVLTNGIWQPDVDLAPPIKRLLAKLGEHGKYQVGIQFISFGRDGDALRRLDKIDDDLGLDEDIVDHEPSTGNVWKMLFGSTDPWFDGSNNKKCQTANPNPNPAGR